MTREYFLGGNTNKGFFSYYSYLADAEKFNKIYIIKGGPGTGKSTTMKAVAKWAEEKEFDVELIHCSSDPDSLDGVVIPKIGVAMVDGTAPHIVDPKFAGAVESIVNMGEFWEETGIKKYKNEIMECAQNISKEYSEAYAYLAAAGNIHNICFENYDKCDRQDIVSEILHNLPFAAKKGKGRVRKLFAEGITPDGIISYADNICRGTRIVLRSENNALTAGIMDGLKCGLINMGYDVEVFYSPLNPEKEIRHIVVEEEDFCVLTGDMISLTNEYNSKVYDIDFPEISGDFLKNKLLEMTLVSRAVKKISAAKKLHDKLESYYVPNIDFDGMAKCRKTILDEIEKISQECAEKHRMVEEI